MFNFPKSFSRRLEQADQKRDQLFEAKKFSDASGEGGLVIHVADFADLKNDQFTDAEQTIHFAEEAENVKKEREFDHQWVLIRQGIDLAMLRDDLTDPKVTDLMIIGPGSASEVSTSDGISIDYLWMAENMNHLKQGQIEQRMFGSYPEPNTLSLPLGAFAVNNVANLDVVRGQEPSYAKDTPRYIFPRFSPDRDLLSQAYEHDATIPVLSLIDGQ